MQTLISPREENNAQSGRFSHRIGQTVYTVNIFPKEGKSEALEDKVLRLILRELEFGASRGYIGNSTAEPDEKNEKHIEFQKTEFQKTALQLPKNHVKMAMPQADRLPDRSSI